MTRPARPAVSIRRARAADADGLTACIRAAYECAVRRWPDLPDVADGVDDAIATDRVWVAARGGNIVGGVILKLSDQAHLVNVAVHPAHSGTGIGTRLIDTAVESARAGGYRTLELATHAGMTGNQKLYARLGWKITLREGNKVMMSRPL